MLGELTWYAERKDLLRYLVVSKLELDKNQMLFGYLWWVLEPLLLMLIYWLLVQVILQRGGPDYPLFLLCGLVPFRAFAVSVNQSTSSLVSNFSIISHVNFPRIFLALADSITNHVKLLLGFVVIFAAAVFYGHDLSYKTILILVPYAIQLILVMGLAMMLSVLGAYFRDMKKLIVFVVRFLTYASPILYSVDRIPESFRPVFLANPLAPIITTYRDVVMYDCSLDYNLVFLSLCQAVMVFVIGYVTFAVNDRKILKLL